MTAVPRPSLTLVGSTSPAPAPALRVAVLGPLVITGTAGDLQPRQAELVVALAVAGPAGLSPDALRGRLGADADHPLGAESLRQLITRTRRRLGSPAVGGEYITFDAAGRYRLDPSVSLDWHEFRALARRGHRDRDPRPLRDALGLLRGDPADGLYWWWLDTLLVDAVRTEVVEAASELACLELEAGDPVSARRAAHAGLAADPAAEHLWRQVMLAEDMAGNRAGVHRAWARCLSAIAEIAPAGEAHPKTTALYRAITAPHGTRPVGLVHPAGPGQHRARMLADRRSDGRAAG